MSSVSLAPTALLQRTAATPAIATPSSTIFAEAESLYTEKDTLKAHGGRGFVVEITVDAGPPPTKTLQRRTISDPGDANLPGAATPTNPAGKMVNSDVPTAGDDMDQTDEPQQADTIHPPLGKSLDAISSGPCKDLCTGDGPSGNTNPVVIYDGYTTTHNGSHVTTNHTVIYCQDCVAHSNITVTSPESIND